MAPRADGTLPGRARCKTTAGGCGRSVRVRHPAPAAPPGGPAAVLAWDPPSVPHGLSVAAEPCPHCGRPEVRIEPRGTRRACTGCRRLVVPPGVLAPYERGPEATRTARSQREWDDDAKRTVILAGEFLRRVAALLADPKIHPASADLLAWYQEEITDARRSRDAARLAELADEFDADKAVRAFRRRHWWDGEPAALATGQLDDEDDDDGQGAALESAGRADVPDGRYVGADGAAPAAISAAPRTATWADAFAVQGWRLAPWDDSGTCQVTEANGRCPNPTGGHPPVSDGLTADGWVCTGHYEALSATCKAVNRARGIT